MATNTSARANPSAKSGINETGWDRRRLMAILAATVAAAILMLVGLVYAVGHVVGTLGAEDPPAGPATGVATGPGFSPSPSVGAARRDQIAAAPMLEVPVEAMQAAEDSSRAAGEATSQMRVPSGTDLGPTSVLTGFPHTPEGAVGQLGQLETTVLQTMSLTAAHDAYQAWALPGGVGAKSWALTQSVQTFLDHTGMGEAKDPAATVTTEPVGALVKGTDGPDWVAACVLVKVSAVYREQGQVAFGHCERMQWVGGRWMVAPGTPPAPAPSTWPGTELARAAGWRTWISDTPVDTHRHIDNQTKARTGGQGGK